MRKTALCAAGIAAAVILSLTGCAADSATSSSSSAGSVVSVVASTDVWGSIAEAIGGNDVTVTSIIASSSQDPHEYQATSRDQLAVNQAQLVISNGGGYDDFMDTMLSAAGSGSRTTINAVDVSGLQASASAAGDSDFNEHIWYDFDAVKVVASDIADSLSSIDPADSATFASNFQSFSDQLDTLNAGVAKIAADHAGTGVAITEPVPLYLLDAAGLVNKTPSEFSEAIEAGTDVSPLVLSQVESLFTSKAVALLAYNSQTVTTQTEAVKSAASSAGVAVLGFTETLPDGVSDYISWMTDNVDNVQKALDNQ